MYNAVLGNLRPLGHTVYGPVAAVVLLAQDKIKLFLSVRLSRRTVADRIIDGTRSSYACNKDRFRFRCAKSVEFPFKVHPTESVCKYFHT